ncbi:MAG: ABC transporter ATP-binding protein [Clostridiales bacterium]|jgi:putative ABC transport system ATP-binding protein|nr:ABC transporter ATP-binding protein [Clostridiales bacterium]
MIDIKLGNHSSAIVVQNITKEYGNRRQLVRVLHGISFEFAKAKMTAVMGPSGSGKSTLLHCVAGLDRPTTGTVTIGNTDITQLKTKELDALRRDRIGFIFQVYNLMPMLTVYENVVLPLQLSKKSIDKDTVLPILHQVGLADHIRKYPSQLSGGQQQRVAIARTLVARPDVLFADEPTGALDTHTGQSILELLRSTVDKDGQTVIMVTHDPRAACFADQVVFLVDGKIYDTLCNPTLERVTAEIANWH